MTPLQAALLGLLQGLTEFLPVSSSGHLVLLEDYFQLDTPSLLTFDIVVHAGTLLALVVYFWRDILALLQDLFSFKKWSRLLLPLFFGSLPAVALGLLFKDEIELYTRSTEFVGWMLILTAALLLLSDFFTRKSPQKSCEQLPFWKALIIGCFQALALLPGISRSGSTLAGGTFLGLSKVAAARFSFLLGMIAIFGATLLSLGDFSASALPFSTLAIGFGTAFASGLLTVWLFLRLLPRLPLAWFALYLLALASFLFLR